MDYVKTSTGFNQAGATVEDVRLMKEAVAGRSKGQGIGRHSRLEVDQGVAGSGSRSHRHERSLKILAEWRAEQSGNR